MVMVDTCPACGGTGWAGEAAPLLRRRPCVVCHGSGTTKLSETDYNKLEPPSNPDFPWKGEEWQPLCYYCCQPIQMTPPQAMYCQRVYFHWEHVNPAATGGKYIEGSHWHCDPAKIRPDAEAPRCHICGTQTTHHAGVCSAGGNPPYHATTMDRKEDELRRMFSRKDGNES